MRTLNRPMFRYGGPIKEGVMNGIREPKRNGGSMTQRVQPSNNGSRPGYAGPATPFIPMIMGAARAGARYIPKGINYLKNLARKQSGTKTVPKQGPTYTVPGKTTYSKGYSGTVPGKTVGPGTGQVPNYVPNFIGNDPTVKLIGGIYKGVTSPTATGVLQKGARLVFSPTGAATGIIYFGGKYYNQKTGKETKKPKGSTLGVNTPSGNNPFGYEDDPLETGSGKKELTAAEREALEAKARREKMDSYKEIMDIKGMNRDAAYKSLIDASKIIQEGGNLKKQLRDGSLIANITQAASRRFDKVGDTEAALRSLVAKGEIDKEMNKEAKALARRKDELAIQTYEKQLKGLSTAEMIQKRLQTAKGEFPQGDELRKIISINNPKLNAKTLPSGDIPTNMDALDYIIGQVAAVNADPKTGDYPDGIYVIKDRIIQVLEGQVTPISVNQLK